MQWGQIKTLLILSFLILDIYLLVQFLEKQQQADLGVLEQNETTIEDKLKSENIKISKLPTKEYKETFISVAPKVLMVNELELLKKLPNQTNEVIQNKFIVTKYKKPITLPKEKSREKMNLLLENMVVNPEEYTFWEWDKEVNVLIYFQNKLDRPIYYNQNGLVLLFLDTNNEVVYSTQTSLGNYEQNEEKSNLINPMRAIEMLYESDKLVSDDVINSVEIGFHTRVPLDSGIQVFAPTWKIKVNDNKDYFVNAIEEFVFLSEHQLFLKEALLNTFEKVSLIKEDKLNKSDFLRDLSEKIELIERSEEDELTI